MIWELKVGTSEGNQEKLCFFKNCIPEPEQVKINKGQ